MRVALVLVTLLVVSGFLAGCVSPPVEAPPTPEVVGDAALLSFLQTAQRPDVSGARVEAWLNAFVGAHTPRLTGTPGEKATAADLEAQLKALGYTVETKLYGAEGAPSVDGPFRAILGIRKGTTHPEELIILGAHYDTAAVGTNGVPYGTLPDGVPVSPPVGPPPTTATYDNGSGTAMVVELARLMANVTPERTVVFALFNGEEEGLVASSAYAKELQASGAHVVAYLGFDMVGIGWPSKAGCLCIYAGKRFGKELNPLQETVAFDLLQYPRGNDTVQVFDNHDNRNSDEGAFASAGFPTMRWAGLSLAGRYWGYHKLNDTMETMIAQAGGEKELQAGFESASATAYYTVLALDHEGFVAGKSS